MLYPKISMMKKERTVRERLEDIKEVIFVLFEIFRNCKSFSLFLEKKLHF